MICVKVAEGYYNLYIFFPYWYNYLHLECNSYFFNFPDHRYPVQKSAVKSGITSISVTSTNQIQPGGALLAISK